MSDRNASTNMQEQLVRVGTLAQALPLAMTAGTGITTGVGTILRSSVSRLGTLIETRIVMDITGLNCGGTAGDIIGKDATANCHIGRITAAVNGTIYGGFVRCLEAPTTGDPDIDLWAANEATGTEDAAISGLTGEAQLTNAGDMTLGSVAIMTAFPTDGQYLYLVCGTATAGTYAAGKIEIVLYGS